jgi:hypothetical protein
MRATHVRFNVVDSRHSPLERGALSRGIFSKMEELSDEIHRNIGLRTPLNTKSFRRTDSTSAILAAVTGARIG